jgi:hypothetical protein
MRRAPHLAFGHPLPADAGRGVMTKERRFLPFAPRSGEKVAEGRMRGAVE